MATESPAASKLDFKTFQGWLDAFHFGRNALVNGIVYGSMRLYATELDYSDVVAGKYPPSSPEPALELEGAGDHEGLLELSERCVSAEHDRRKTVAEKARTLLSVTSLLLALIGLLLPKSFAFDSLVLRLICFAAILGLLNTVVLVLAFFAVGQEQQPSLTADDVSASADSLKCRLIRKNLSEAQHAELRTDFLVDLFKAARFFFLLAFSTVVVLFAITFLLQQPKDQTRELITALRADPQLLQLLTGPAGKPGANGAVGEKGAAGLRGRPGKVGARGPKGDSIALDEAQLLKKLLGDPEFTARVGQLIQESKSKDKPGL